MTPQRHIQVYARLRPAQPADGRTDPDEVVMVGCEVQVANPRRIQGMDCFSVDGCFDQAASQGDIMSAVRPLLEAVFDGKNATIFAYGVTGSGKTHTMQGTVDEPGLISSTAEAIFQCKANSPHMAMHVSCSYVEILKDEVYDLLADRSHGMKRLDLRTDQNGDVVVADRVMVSLASLEEFLTIYSMASKIRKTASTRLNSSSSRSHAILTFYVHSRGISHEPATCGKVTLIDLAGSESNKGAGKDPERIRESSAINTSLTTLGNVVHAINTHASRVPYRDSKLTRMLQDVLSGGSAGLLLCCLAPGRQFLKDNLNTLRFAERARSIKLGSGNSRRSSNLSQAPSGRNSLGAYSSGRTSLGVFRDPPSGLAEARGYSSVLGDRTNLLPASEPPRESFGKTGRKSLGKAPRQSLGKPVPRQLLQMDEKAVSSPKGEAGPNPTHDQGAAAAVDENQRADMVNKLFDARWEKTAAQLGSVDTGVTSKEALPSMPQEKPTPAEGPSPDPTPRLAEMNRDETDEQNTISARVLIDIARWYHAENNLHVALEHYSTAAGLVPDNRHLARRIVEIRMAISGAAPIPRLSRASLARISRWQMEVSRAGGGIHVLGRGQGTLAESTEDGAGWVKRAGGGWVQGPGLAGPTKEKDGGWVKMAGGGWVQMEGGNLPVDRKRKADTDDLGSSKLRRGAERTEHRRLEV